MDRALLVELLTLRPFQPFEVVLSSGQTVEVRHPEVAALGKSRMIVIDPETDQSNFVSLLHITNVRTLANA